MHKKDERIERLEKWGRGIPQPPTTIELVPTDKCNFNCGSCWRQGISEEDLEKKYNMEIGDERLLKLVDEAHEIGVLEFAFVGGGEPLCRDITYRLMKKIRKYGMEGDLVTNGSLLTEEMMETLVEVGWTRIKFSIDGSDEKLQDELRGIKCYKNILENIKTLNRLKKEKKKDFPKIGFNTVISNKNYKDLPNIIGLAHEIGCNEILILPLTIFSDEGKKLKLDHEQMVEFQGIIKECLPKLKKYNIFSNLEEFMDLRYVDKTNSMHEVLMEEAEKVKGDFKTVPCFEPWKHITIIANGNIACCFNDYVWNTTVTIKDRTLKELWYGPEFEKYREQVLTRKLPEACATCCVWRVFETKGIREKLNL
ncbi:hypothetical protein CL621_03995 [archaeon]|nr:hypothetical protein [archaeon]|tara:strand:+ start:2028 stop:3125 length:1098 start_codon:yes stop_codon:yes gene_type:complete